VVDGSKKGKLRLHHFVSEFLFLEKSERSELEVSAVVHSRVVCHVIGTFARTLLVEKLWGIGPISTESDVDHQILRLEMTCTYVSSPYVILIFIEFSKCILGNFEENSLWSQ
jgi:hypothetical protein